jgi:hypothetical protein
MLPTPSVPGDPDRNGHQDSPPLGESPRPPQQSPPPAADLGVTDLPPVRRVLGFLYLLAGLCIVLAAVLWWRILQ